MTTEDLSDLLRRRSASDRTKSHRGSNTSQQQIGAGDMVPSTSNRRCCQRHKFKLGGIIMGIILFGGLVGSIGFALVYFRRHRVEGCLLFSKSRSCFAADASPYRHYATKTDYYVAKAELVTPIPDLKPGCEPVHFYLLSRHAIRYPDKEEIAEMGIKLPELRGRIEKAGRFQKMFPSLLNDSYTKERYAFYITDKIRTKETAIAFARGLFKQDINAIPYDVKADLLHFNKKCTEILLRNGFNKDKAEEQKKFEVGELMKQTLSDIATRIGINVSFDDAKLMMRACAFDYSINQDRFSPWCAVFHKNNVRVLEYYEDIDDYNADHYGNPRNYEQACPLIKDMIDQIRTVIAGTMQRKASLYFTHAGVVKKVYARLGLFKDNTQFKAERFCASVPRKWRSSLICPFNSNLAVVLYNCGGKHYVEAYVQEKPVILGGCTSTLCPWEVFQKTYVAATTNCDLETICMP